MNTIWRVGPEIGIYIYIERGLTTPVGKAQDGECGCLDII